LFCNYHYKTASPFFSSRNLQFYSGDFLQFNTDADNRVKEVVMATAEKLIKQGKREGRLEGKREESWKMPGG